MIRLRRLPSRFLRPRVYEIEFIDEGDSARNWRRVTSTPVNHMEPYLGVGDAWALVDAANDAWNGEVGDWVSMPES